MQLILASASPRRQELLKLFGVPFLVRAADIDETMDPGKAPFDEVARVSRLKALAVSRDPGDIVIAADTIVVCEGRVLGKPRSQAEATEMLQLLSGRDHQVMTGCTILRDRAALPCSASKWWAITTMLWGFPSAGWDRFFEKSRRKSWRNKQ